MENEFLTFGRGPIASIGALLLHSAAAREMEDGQIRISSTSYASDLGANEFAEFSVTTWGEAFNWLRENDKKAEPVSLGYRKCWECGTWFKSWKCPVCEEEN
ncbi:hypothetical protein FACS1894187_23620 [Synergistales bacterium]|nr:hypothetical protein FACS1894187_23620 [Synergistales bacterium]